MERVSALTTLEFLKLERTNLHSLLGWSGHDAKGLLLVLYFFYMTQRFRSVIEPHKRLRWGGLLMTVET